METWRDHFDFIWQLAKVMVAFVILFLMVASAAVIALHAAVTIFSR